MTIELGGIHPAVYVLPTSVTLARGSYIQLVSGKSKGSHVILLNGRNLLDLIQERYQKEPGRKKK